MSACHPPVCLSTQLWDLLFTCLSTGPQTETHTNFRDGLIAEGRELMKDAHRGDKKSDRSIVFSPSRWIQLSGVSRCDVEETNVKTQSKTSFGSFETQRHPPRSPSSLLSPHSKQELILIWESWGTTAETKSSNTSSSPVTNDKYTQNTMFSFFQNSSYFLIYPALTPCFNRTLKPFMGLYIDVIITTSFDL